MDIGLDINNLHVRLDMPLGRSEFTAAGIVKPGFFAKPFLRPFPYKRDGDTVLWAKNPVVSCFGGQAGASPNASISMIRGMSLRAGRDFICGTSAYFFFNDGALRLVIAQVIMSFSWAQRFTEEFREAAVSRFGKGHCTDLRSIPVLGGSTTRKQEYLLCSWTDETGILVSELAATGDKAWVRWGHS